MPIPARPQPMNCARTSRWWRQAVIALFLAAGWIGAPARTWAAPAEEATPAPATPPAAVTATLAPATTARATMAPAADSAVVTSAATGPAATMPITTMPAGTPSSAVPAPSAGPTPAPAVDADLVSVSFRDVPVEQIFVFISEKTGKPVIPQESIKQKRITVMGTQKRPLDEAMQIIQEALRQNGIVMEESPRVINMKSISEARQSMLTVVPAEQSVTTLPNQAQVVHKIFELRYFDVGKMKDVVLPMLPDFGHIMADPNTRRLMVTDTVEDLGRIERMINSLDVAQADQTIKKIIVIKKGDAADIVATLRVIVAGSLPNQARDILAGTAPRGGGGDSGGGGNAAQMAMAQGGMGAPGNPGSPNGPGGRGGGGGGAGGAGGGAASAIFVEENKAPVVLLADVSRNWIIAVASARMMTLIDEWVARLDVATPAEDAQFDVLEVNHADIDEISRQVAQTIDALPTGDAQKSVRIVPYTQSRKIMVTGSKRGRDLVRSLIADLDREAGNQTMRVFPLQYADATEVAASIDQLYGASKGQDYNPFFFDYPRRTQQTPKRVKVTADTRRNAIVVISDTAMLDQIAKLLKEQWDLPLSEEEAQPKIYALKYVDPVKLKDMLDKLFFKNAPHSADSPFFFDMIMDAASSRNDQPIGRLYGQFRFQAMPDSNRLLVIAKNAANYAVMDALIAQLDQPQDAGLPQMVELKHANAEDLVEQLNATLAESGTLAEILRAKRDLSASNRQNGPTNTNRSATNSNAGNSNNANQQTDSANANVMTFWWQRSRPTVDEKPTSNLIGKIRFVPVNRRNALLIVAPPAYLAPLRELVEQLDQPGLQVMIHVIIAEVQNNDASTLGMRLASDPSIFKDSRLMDGAIAGAGSVNAYNIIGMPGTATNNTIFTGNLNVNVLVQLLMRKYDLKILFEPKLYTADNQEAEFFDGQDVPIQTQSQTSSEGTNVVQAFTYTSVGTYLRIRPHITNDHDVDLTINLQLSDIVEGETSLGNFIFDRRETNTHVIMRDGQTVMLSGIIRQSKSRDVRKLPLLGDIPLVGPVFRSTDSSLTKREMVAFITPHVIRSQGEPAATGAYKRWIGDLRHDLNGGVAPTTEPTENLPDDANHGEPAPPPTPVGP